ncbi:START domain-containing protein [Marivirga harenae]|uniref:START domain-containing protein n=1 Tax=Marivirga harenae TaxID=2010992 RepID=UPI0026DEAC88|nr:START domain-containing protein [Marivirga harenae]WKV13215.1 START domain-containing protein [Marivirga harenae]|tara:strand:- start:14796 stop:15398 length:603 start_codon:yes stop_codon:yes gene_type:complete
MNIQTLVLSIVFAGNSISVLSQTAWEVDLSEDDIIVYTRFEEDSEFKSFKAFMLIEASPNEIVEVLENANNYTEWYGFTKTANVLDQGNGIQYNYVETIFPWPYNNRDMVYKMVIDNVNSKEVFISLEGIPDYLPEKKGIVRMRKAKGFIKLKSSGKYTELTYQFHSEPGENIPVWLANISIAELPFTTLTGLRKILAED